MSEQVAGVSETGRAAAALRPRIGPSLARRLAWLAIAGQILFVASWIVAGALEPGYSHLRESVSALGARDAVHPWIVTTAIVMLGFSIAALGASLLAGLPRRPATLVAAAAFAGAGLAIALTGAFPIDCSLGADAACKARFDAGQLSWRTDAHLWLIVGFDLLFLVTPFAIARALWPTPVAALSLACGLFGVGFTAVAFAADTPTAVNGLAQRIGFLTMHLWVLFVAIGVLHVLARTRDDASLIPVGPRDFFGRAWAGGGEILVHPTFLSRRFPLRLAFQRETRWLSDDAWIVEDTTTAATGYTATRRMVCTMDGPDRVRVTADDLPRGAELELTEGGYRVRPYRFAYPIGPVRVTFTCRESARPLPDGSFEWTIAFRWLGVPLGRFVGRVRRAAESSA